MALTTPCPCWVPQGHTALQSSPPGLPARAAIPCVPTVCNTLCMYGTHHTMPLLGASGSYSPAIFPTCSTCLCCHPTLTYATLAVLNPKSPAPNWAPPSGWHPQHGTHHTMPLLGVSGRYSIAISSACYTCLCCHPTLTHRVYVRHSPHHALVGCLRVVQPSNLLHPPPLSGHSSLELAGVAVHAGNHLRGPSGEYRVHKESKLMGQGRVDSSELGDDCVDTIHWIAPARNRRQVWGLVRLAANGARGWNDCDETETCSVASVCFHHNFWRGCPIGSELTSTDLV